MKKYIQFAFCMIICLTLTSCGKITLVSEDGTKQLEYSRRHFESKAVTIEDLRVIAYHIRKAAKIYKEEDNIMMLSRISNAVKMNDLSEMERIVWEFYKGHDIEN